MELKEYCIGHDRTKENVDELTTMEWLNKSNIAIPHDNLTAIKDLILCMDVSSPNYKHLTKKEQEKVKYLIENEWAVNTVLVTLFRWFGTHVGSYCINDIIVELKKTTNNK